MSKSKTQSVESLFGSEEEPSSSSPSSRVLATALNGEADERLAALVTPYGVGTRSYNASPEKREVDRQRKAVTANYKPAPETQPVMCDCPMRPWHEIFIHRRLAWDGDYRAWVGDWNGNWVQEKPSWWRAPSVPA
jgi:hypothetical protein